MTRKNPLSIIVITSIVMTLSININALHADYTDPAYHTVEEIRARIFALQDSLPDWVRVERIGFSQEDKLPIYAVKVNFRVSEDVSERPAIVFHDLHAEEILGVEYSMWLLEELAAHCGQANAWLKEIDTWIIPTSNPEGLTAVYAYDPSWRKNKRCNLKDGRFRFFPGWGGDTSGVDLNRNFPLFWVHGDGFLTGKGNELYDYYRGPGPLSEAESQALDRFMDRIRPVFAITLHSSRTGNFAERIFYPWGRGWMKYSNPKFSPDIHTLQQLTELMASRTHKYGHQGTTYLPAPIGSTVGDCDTYFYWKYGIISMRIEIGAAGEGMQPDSAGIMDVIESCRMGIGYLFNCMTDKPVTNEDEKGVIDQKWVILKTIQDGGPCEAVIDMKTLTTPMMPFRPTSPRTGMYFWPVLEGFTDTLTARKYGYYTRRGEVIGQNAGSSPLEIEMIPLPMHNLTLEAITPDSVAIHDSIEIEIRHLWSPGYIAVRGSGGWTTPSDPVRIEVPPSFPDNEQYYTMGDGRIEIELPEGGFRFTFVSGSRFVPRQVEIVVDTSITKQVILAEAVTLLDQDFDGGDILYTSDNVNNPAGQAGDSLSRWEVTGGIFHTPPRSLTDSRYKATFENEDGWCAPYNLLGDHFSLETAGCAALVYWLNQALEPGFDSMWVEVSTGGEPGSDPNGWTWTPVGTAHQELSVLENVPEKPWNGPPINYQMFAPWKRFVVVLDTFCGDPVFHFRFHLRTDEFIREDGVYIDDVMLLASSVTPPSMMSNLELPECFELGQPYPNPFNSRLNVPIYIPGDGWVKLTLYDITGKVVFKGTSINYQTGSHMTTIEAGSLPSGLYLLSGTSDFGRGLRKVMLIK